MTDTLLTIALSISMHSGTWSGAERQVNIVYNEKATQVETRKKVGFVIPDEVRECTSLKIRTSNEEEVIHQ
jgi:hypothetical protein